MENHRSWQLAAFNKLENERVQVIIAVKGEVLKNIIVSNRDKLKDLVIKLKEKDVCLFRV